MSTWNCRNVLVFSETSSLPVLHYPTEELEQMGYYDNDGNHFGSTIYCCRKELTKWKTQKSSNCTMQDHRSFDLNTCFTLFSHRSVSCLWMSSVLPLASSSTSFSLNSFRTGSNSACASLALSRHSWIRSIHPSSHQSPLCLARTESIPVSKHLHLLNKNTRRISLTLQSSKFVRFSSRSSALLSRKRFNSLTCKQNMRTQSYTQ